MELSDQLRGRAGQRPVPYARLALAENGSGSLGSAASLVLTILAR